MASKQLKLFPAGATHLDTMAEQGWISSPSNANEPRWQQELRPWGMRVINQLEGREREAQTCPAWFLLVCSVAVLPEASRSLQCLCSGYGKPGLMVGNFKGVGGGRGSLFC